MTILCNLMRSDWRSHIPPAITCRLIQSVTHSGIATGIKFIQQLAQRKKNLVALPDTSMFLYMRHGNNTWKFKSGTFLDPRGWRKVARPETFPIEILQRYSEAATAPA